MKSGYSLNYNCKNNRLIWLVNTERKKERKKERKEERKKERKKDRKKERQKERKKTGTVVCAVILATGRVDIGCLGW